MVNSSALTAEGRETKGKGSARKLRAAGRVPAVIYGTEKGTRSISVDAHELQLLFARIAVESTVIELGVDDKTKVRVLVREVQRHPYRSDILHVDFYQVKAGETVTVEIPIRLEGTAVGVTEGGILDQILYDLEVRCLVDRIPDAIDADVTELAVGDTIHVRDLELPEGVETDVEDDRVVCTVTPPTVAAVEEEDDEDEAEVEVVEEEGE